MGSIGSRNEAVDRLYFEPLRKNQVYKGCDVLRVDDRTYVVRLPNGRCHGIGAAARLNGKVCIIGFGKEQVSKTVLYGLVRIGALTQEDADEHVRQVELMHEKRALSYLEKDVARMVKEHGAAYMHKLVDEAKAD